MWIILIFLKKTILNITALIGDAHTPQAEYSSRGYERPLFVGYDMHALTWSARHHESGLCPKEETNFSNHKIKGKKEIRKVSFRNLFRFMFFLTNWFLAFRINEKWFIGFFVVCEGQQLPGGGYLGQVLLGMCRWPLRTPTPLQSILWPTIHPILVTFEQMSLWFQERNSMRADC